MSVSDVLSACQSAVYLSVIAIEKHNYSSDSVCEHSYRREDQTSSSSLLDVMGTGSFPFSIPLSFSLC